MKRIRQSLYDDGIDRKDGGKGRKDGGKGRKEYKKRKREILNNPLRENRPLLLK